jgi:hypothetical protein
MVQLAKTNEWLSTKIIRVALVTMKKIRTLAPQASLI